MTGEDIPGLVCFTTLGNATGHIRVAIEKLQPSELVIFTSSDLHDPARPVYKEIIDSGVSLRDIILLHPFEHGALEKMISRMLMAYQTYITKQSNSALVSLTGGTNLMAVAMGLFALIQGLDAYYVLNDSTHDIMPITLFESMNQLKTLSAMKTRLIEVQV